MHRFYSIKMSKRDLSPASRERNERPYQQQKSISDVIGPMVDQCNLDLESGQSLASLASQNAESAEQKNDPSSNGTERNSLECEQGLNLADEILFDEGYTDPDGRIGDAAKAVGRASKKAIESVADDVQTVVRGTMDITRHIAEDIEDTVDSSVDLIGAGVNVTTGLVKACITTQDSLEEKPSNNVYISHPTEGAANMVPMGMHIQPFTSKNRSGLRVLTVEPGKLAEQANLKENDVIIAIGSKDVQNVTLEEALHIFGTIANTFSMMILRRILPIEGINIPLLVKRTITVEVHINDDNVVAIKILEIRGVYWQPNATSPKLISHKPGSIPRSYLNVTHDGTLGMSTQVNTNECHFQLNIYTPDDGNYNRVYCTVHNIRYNKVLKIQQQDNVYRVDLGPTTGLTNDENESITVDLRFFLLHHPNGQNGFTLLESSISATESTTGHFLAVENGELKLLQHSYDSNEELRNIDSKFRFELHAATSQTPTS